MSFRSMKTWDRISTILFIGAVAYIIIFSQGFFGMPKTVNFSILWEKYTLIVFVVPALLILSAILTWKIKFRYASQFELIVVAVLIASLFYTYPSDLMREYDRDQKIATTVVSEDSLKTPVPIDTTKNVAPDDVNPLEAAYQAQKTDPAPATVLPDSLVQTLAVYKDSALKKLDVAKRQMVDSAMKVNIVFQKQKLREYFQQARAKIDSIVNVELVKQLKSIAKATLTEEDIKGIQKENKGSWIGKRSGKTKGSTAAGSGKDVCKKKEPSKKSFDPKPGYGNY